MTTRYARSVASWIDVQLAELDLVLDDPELARAEVALCRLACSLLLDAPPPEEDADEEPAPHDPDSDPRLYCY